MKIAIGAMDENTESKIAQEAGRAPFYLIFENGELIEVVKNPFSIGGGGAGLGVAKMLADKSVNKVIAGKFGDKMVDALKSRNVDFEVKDGIINNIL